MMKSKTKNRETTGTKGRTTEIRILEFHRTGQERQNGGIKMSGVHGERGAKRESQKRIQQTEQRHVNAWVSICISAQSKRRESKKHCLILADVAGTEAKQLTKQRHIYAWISADRKQVVPESEFARPERGGRGSGVRVRECLHVHEDQGTLSSSPWQWEASLMRESGAGSRKGVTLIPRDCRDETINNGI